MPSVSSSGGDTVEDGSEMEKIARPRSNLPQRSFDDVDRRGIGGALSVPRT